MAHWSEIMVKLPSWRQRMDEQMKEAAKHTVIRPPVETCEFMPLSRQVAALEGNRDAYKALAEQMWGTIEVNWIAGLLVAENGEGTVRFDGLMKRWKEVLDALAG